MAGGIPAGTLSIEVVASIAKLQEDMRAVQRSVGAMSSSVAGSTKAVNDNFATMGRSSEQAARDIAAYGASLDKLRAQYNPVFAAIQQYKSAVAGIRDANRVGAISADEMAAAIARQRRESLAAISAAKGMAPTLSATGSAGKLTGFHMQNLAFQFQDLGIQMVQAAQSGNPLKLAFTALLQQGSQISGIMMQAGVGIRGLAAAIAATVAPIAAPLAAVAVIAGTAFAAFKNFQQQVKDSGELDHYRNSLGLTHKELLQLSDGVDKVGGKIKGLTDVSITAGDTLHGLWQAIAEDATTGPGAKAWETTKNLATKAFNGIIDGWNVTSAAIDAGIHGTFNAIKEVWGRFPAVMGDLFVQGANAAISGIEKLLNAAIGAVNSFIGKANGVLSSMPAPVKAMLGLGGGISEIPLANLGRIANDNAGAAANAAKAVGSSWSDAYDKAKKSNDAFWARVRKNAVQNAKDRMRDEADAIIANRTPKKPSHAGESLAREMEANEALIAENYKLADAYGISDAAALKQQITAKATADAIKKQADVTAYVAQQIRLAVSEKAVDAAKMLNALKGETDARAILNNQVANGQLTSAEADRLLRDEAQLRPLIAAQALAEGEAKAKLAGIIADLRGEQKRSNDELKRSHDLAQAEGLQNQLDLANKQAELAQKFGAQRMGILGSTTAGSRAQEEALAQLNIEMERANILMTAQAQAAVLLKQGLTESAQKTLDLAEAQAKLVGIKGGFEEQERALAKWNGELDGAIDRLSQLGDLGKNVAGWAKALTRGDFSGLSGSAAALADTIFRMPAGTMSVGTGAEKKDVAVTLGDRIEKIFTKGGKFGETMKGLLEGAGTGIAIGAGLFGTGNQSAQMGGAIGGAVGQALATGIKGVSKALGSAAGPIGAVVGSILGSVLGGILGKKPSGSGNVTATSANVSANDGGIKSGLDSFGLGLQQAVAAVADKLGGTVGNYNVGIGAYKDYYQVSSNPNDPRLGRSEFTKYSSSEVYDGKDASAALRAAIAEAIRQGAIEGVRAGTQTLLKSGKDIEAQLAKALKFEAVFSDLKQATDPVGYAIDQITKKFDDLRKIFEEAGATAQDYADLEKLLQIQRADALEQARQDQVSKVRDSIEMGATLLDLLGRKEASLAATRTIELAGVKDTLQPMQAMIYTLQDAKDVIDKFTPLAADLRAFKQELLGTQSQDSFAAVTAKFRDVAALAKGGDATAMGQLRDASNSFLDAAKANASSQLEYQRAVGEVLAAVDQGIFAADSQVDYQQAVIDTAAASEQAAQILAQLASDMKVAQDKIIAQGEWVERIFRRWDGDGLRIQNDSDTPVYTSAV